MAVIPLLQSSPHYFLVTRGDAPRCARRWPLAFIFRAFGAQADSSPWLSYSAPLALRQTARPGFHIPRLWRSGRQLALAFIFRAFGAQADSSPWLSYSAPLALRQTARPGF